MKIITALIMLSLLGCSKSNDSTQSPAPAPAVKVDSHKVGQNEWTDKISNLLLTTVKENFKDPDSVKFEGTETFTTTSPLESGDLVTFSVSVCGRVNAKNSFGGYTGFKDFYVAISITHVDGQQKPNPEGLVIEIDPEQKIIDIEASFGAADQNAVEFKALMVAKRKKYCTDISTPLTP